MKQVDKFAMQAPAGDLSLNQGKLRESKAHFSP